MRDMIVLACMSCMLLPVSVYVVICLNTDDNVRGLCNTIGHAV